MVDRGDAHRHGGHSVLRTAYCVLRAACTSQPKSQPANQIVISRSKHVVRLLSAAAAAAGRHGAGRGGASRGAVRQYHRCRPGRLSVTRIAYESASRSRPPTWSASRQTQVSAFMFITCRVKQFGDRAARARGMHIRRQGRPGARTGRQAREPARHASHAEWTLACCWRKVQDHTCPNNYRPLTPLTRVTDSTRVFERV